MFQINWDTMTSYKLMKLVITCNLKHKKECYEPRYKYIFFLSGFSFKDTDDSQDSRGREGRIIFYSTLPLPPTHEHWDTYLQLFMWDDYHVSLIATLEFTRLLLDEIYHLIELPFHWLIDNAIFICFFDELILGFCYNNFEMGNRRIWTYIDYHPFTTSEPTNQVR